MGACSSFKNESYNPNTEKILKTDTNNEFFLELHYDTGPVSDEYYYYYIISIGPGTKCNFKFSPGRPASQDQSFEAVFYLKREEINEIISFLKQNNIFRNNWPMGDPVDGGSNIYLSMEFEGKKYLTGTVLELTEEDSRLIYKVSDVIKEFVPQEIWSKMEEKQLGYMESY